MRNTFVLTWNPDLWPTDPDARTAFEATWDDQVQGTALGESFDDTWSTGNRTHDIGPGDRAFLLRQHRDRGLVSAGEFTSTVYQGSHWDESGGEANFADVCWTTVLPIGDRLEVEDLEAAVPAVTWGQMQGSGVMVHERKDQQRLEELWEMHLDSLDRLPVLLPDEVPPSDTFVEGAVSRVEVNRFERDPRARQACLDHWGHTCSVCGFNFADRYGELGNGYIHVHHLRELSTIGEKYEINPVKDLRPVCPNCHAMIHRERPALDIDQVRAMLRKK